MTLRLTLDPDTAHTPDATIYRPDPLCAVYLDDETGPTRLYRLDQVITHSGREFDARLVRQTLRGRDYADGRYCLIASDDLRRRFLPAWQEIADALVRAGLDRSRADAALPAPRAELPRVPRQEIR